MDLLPNARQVFFGLDGEPAVGGFVYTWLPNTTTPVETFQDPLGQTPNANPIELDSLGSAAIWAVGSIRQRVTDSLGNIIWDAETQVPGSAEINGSGAGLVAWYAVDTPPVGFLECNGAAVSRTTYNLLFSAIGTQWGAGDSSTTFNLPDLRGYFLRAWDDGANVDTGRAFGTIQSDTLSQTGVVSSTGTVSSGKAVGTVPLPGTPGGGQGGATGGQNISQSGGPYNSNSATLTVTGTVVSSGTVTSTATETRPKNIALLPCISTGQGLGGQPGTGLYNVRTASGAITLAPTDALVFVDTTGGPGTVSAPGTLVTGQVFEIKKLPVGGAGTLKLALTLDGTVSPTGTVANQYYRIAYNGSNWSSLR